MGIKWIYLIASHLLDKHILYPIPLWHVLTMAVCMWSLVSNVAYNMSGNLIVRSKSELLNIEVIQDIESKFKCPIHGNGISWNWTQDPQIIKSWVEHFTNWAIWPIHDLGVGETRSTRPLDQWEARIGRSGPIISLDYRKELSLAHPYRECLNKSSTCYPWVYLRQLKWNMFAMYVVMDIGWVLNPRPLEIYKSNWALYQLSYLTHPRNAGINFPHALLELLQDIESEFKCPVCGNGIGWDWT